MRIPVGVVAVCLLVCAGGCITGRQFPAATQPATTADVKTVHPEYWLEQPAVARVDARAFDPLWNTCRRVTEGIGFTIDRTDYRDGLLTTLPLTSKQFFEFWRGDVVTVHDLNQSSLGTMRRTVRWQIRHRADGSYEAEPKVIVERYVSVERRITNVAQYRDIFSIRLIDVDRQTEAGTPVPAAYWYAVGRDHALERNLAHRVDQALHG